MSARRTMLLIIAGMIALIVMVAARSLMTGGKQQASAPPPTTEILVAGRDLPTGTILKELDLKWTTWPADAADASKYIVKGKGNISDAAGAVLRNGMRNNDPIMPSNLVRASERGFLAAVLTPGYKAMAVTLTPSSGVAGFIFPGDHVDVILTHPFSRKDIPNLDDRIISETVLHDVRVLALDQKTNNQATDPKVAQLATLEVTAKQAERLALAANIATQTSGGKAMLTLALRSLAIEDGTGATAATNAPPPPATDESSTTWDSDVSRGYPSINGTDNIVQRVQVMRGKEVTESNFGLSSIPTGNAKPTEADPDHTRE